MANFVSKVIRSTETKQHVSHFTHVEQANLPGTVFNVPPLRGRCLVTSLPDYRLVQNGSVHLI